jgi:hypothetical protein
MALSSSNLQLADWVEAVLPDYAGGSVANVPASILSIFDAPPLKPDSPTSLLPALRPDILPEALVHDARAVVLLVLDGVGYRQLDAALESGDLPGFARAGHRSRLTSIFPSSTAAALTSLQVGVGPGTHGLAGYTLHLPAQQRVVNMIKWKPVGGGHTAKPMPLPESFLPVPTIYQHLAAAGIPSVVVSQAAFAKSALTRVHCSGVPYAGHRTLSEFPALLLREAQKPGRRFVFGYWDGFDVVGHSYGPASMTAGNELRLIDRALEQGLLEPLERLGGDVAVILTADHGQTAIPLNRRRNLAEVTGLTRRWSHQPTGEPRALGLALQEPADLDRVREFIAGDGVVLPVTDALAMGLYGPGPWHPELVERVGNTLVLAKAETAMTYPGANSQSIGGHGSLTEEEMLVPLLAWRFS